MFTLATLGDDNSAYYFSKIPGGKGFLEEVGVGGGGGGAGGGGDMAVNLPRFSDFFYPERFPFLYRYDGNLKTCTLCRLHSLNVYMHDCCTYFLPPTVGST